MPQISSFTPPNTPSEVPNTAHSCTNFVQYILFFLQRTYRRHHASSRFAEKKTVYCTKFVHECAVFSTSDGVFGSVKKEICGTAVPPKCVTGPTMTSSGITTGGDGASRPYWCRPSTQLTLCIVSGGMSNKTFPFSIPARSPFFAPFIFSLPRLFFQRRLKALGAFARPVSQRWGHHQHRFHLVRLWERSAAPMSHP